MPAKGVERAAGPRRLLKAEEFLRSAEHAMTRSDHDAAASSAALAGIAAADAFLIWHHGVVSRDQNHSEAATLLGDRGGEAVRAQVNGLRRLLAVRSQAQYDDRLVTAREARDAVVRAERLVAWAKDSLKGETK